MGYSGKIDKSRLPAYGEPMTISAKPPAFLPLAKLPRTPASDLKRLGWRGMLNALRSKGKLLVTHHDEPEAVIIGVAEYDALMQLVEQSKAQAESALAGLRRSFDERLSVLQGRSATTRLQSTLRGHAKLGGKVKVGSGY